MKKFFSATIITLCCLLLLPGCFTGIESTPLITEKDVKKVTGSDGAADGIAAQLAPPPASQWQPGRRFMVTDPKISLIFEREPAIAAGSVIIFDRLSPQISITGDTISVLTFHRDGDKTPLRYKIGVAPSQISSMFTLPMSVDLDMVEHCSRQLSGKKYYIITPLRVDSTLTPVANGQRYVEVTIKSVAPGNADYPLRADIIDSSGNHSSVAMTAGSSRSATRNFDKLFTTSNPRLRYPAITDAVWNNIVNSRVAAGMNIEECHLSLGSPRDVRKWHNGGTFFEMWTFDNGRNLIFEDGLLATIR